MLPETLREYENYEFSNLPTTGKDYVVFENRLKSYIARNLPKGYRIYQWIRGHYESSAVIETDDMRYIYLCFMDVRYYPGAWHKKILYRSMRCLNDFRGGVNRYSDFDNLFENIQKI